MYRVTPQRKVTRVLDSKGLASPLGPTGLAMDGASHLLIADQGKLYRLRLADRKLEPIAAAPAGVTGFAWDRFGRLYLVAIAPFRYRKSRAEAKEVLKEVIRSLPRTKLLAEDESYLHYEFTSLLLRFVDDVEFLFDDETKTIHFRSASRTGYGDMGVNRKRMEQVRTLVGAKL